MEPTYKMQRILEVNWHKQFPKKNVIQTRFIPVDKAFQDYLTQDGTFINPRYTREWDGTTEIPEKDIDLGDMPLFPLIQQQILEALKDFKEVIIKLAWRSPKDCKSWLQQIKCTHIEDIFMALKCSEYISQSLDDYQPFWWADHTKQRLYLVIKKFIPIDKSQEFRCFVKNNWLVGACQRNPQNIFQSLINKDQKQNVSEAINNLVLDKFKDVKDYVVDLYLSEEPIVIDIAPWGQPTNSLMFSWSQLVDNDYKWRIVRTKEDILYQDLRDYNIPSDFVDNSKVSELMALMKQHPELFM